MGAWMSFGRLGISRAVSLGRPRLGAGGACLGPLAAGRSARVVIALALGRVVVALACVVVVLALALACVVVVVVVLALALALAGVVVVLALAPVGLARRGALAAWVVESLRLVGALVMVN